MKTYHAYPLLSLIPSVMLATIAAVLAGATVAGVLWVFIYGDNVWPSSADTVVIAVASLVGLVVLASLLLLARRVGKDQDSRGGLRKAHVLVAIGLSIGLPLLVLLHQWQFGNLGNAQVLPSNSFKPTPLVGIHPDMRC